MKEIKVGKEYGECETKENDNKIFEDISGGRKKYPFLVWRRELRALV